MRSMRMGVWRNRLSIERFARQEALKHKAVGRERAHRESGKHRGRPWQHGHGHAGGGRRLDHAKTGVGNGWHACVGNEQDERATRRVRHKPVRPLALVVVVERNEPPRNRHAKAPREV